MRSSTLLTIAFLAVFFCASPSIVRCHSQTSSPSKEEPPSPGKVQAAANGELVEPRASLSIQQVRDKTTTRVTISWSGQEAESLLVVSVEAAEEALLEREVRTGETRLSGIVLVRQARAQGEATVTLPHEPVSGFLGERRGQIRVFLTKVMDVKFVGGDPSVKGATRVDRTEYLRPQQAGPAFRIVCAARDIANLSRVLPDTKPWSFEVQEREVLRAVMDCDDQLAFLQVPISFSDDGSP